MRRRTWHAMKVLWLASQIVVLPGSRRLDNELCVRQLATEIFNRKAEVIDKLQVTIENEYRENEMLRSQLNSRGGPVTVNVLPIVHDATGGLWAAELPRPLLMFPVALWLLPTQRMFLRG